VLGVVQPGSRDLVEGLVGRGGAPGLHRVLFDELAERDPGGFLVVGALRDAARALLPAIAAADQPRRTDPPLDLTAARVPPLALIEHPIR
jgi:hypothetical protein